MAHVLLFCAGDVSPKVIDRLITKSQSHSPSFNCWTLIRGPSQAVKDEETPVPVESFSTGFKGASIDSLAGFVTSRIPEPVGLLTPYTFAVLDERSERDDTVLLVHQVTSYPDKDPEDTNPDPSTAKKEWKQWRVTFVSGQWVVSVLEEGDDLLTESFDDSLFSVDADGVLHVRRIEGS
ncbi:hypothetical protein EV356DRAFT_497718 [Viridothelium virens]|uniref:Uncharacterized protein n=1 Tax=Viridothelium virens TaxID=1048519 RepID=A0A6A6HFF1_VIRVR|nr:hypothetical protein EV356DRAFT_497718 [Viridothelium virens]